MNRNGIGGNLMPFPKNYSRSSISTSTKHKFLAFGAVIFIILAIVIFINAQNHFYLKAEKIAKLKASDIILSCVQDKITNKLTNADYNYNYFVELQKNSLGNITAISANTSNISTFSEQILSELAGKVITFNISTCDFSEFKYFNGKGLLVPVKVRLSDSGNSNFNNIIETSSTNELLHQLSLEINIPFELSIKKRVFTSEVNCKMIIAESIIVGQKP